MTEPNEEPPATPGYLIGGAVMCLILLVVAVLALTSPLDPLGTPAAILIVVVAVGGPVDLARLMRRRH